MTLRPERERVTVDEQTNETPDWPFELADPVARLGQPSQVFRIPRSHAARKTISGLVLIIGGILANYVYWIVLNGQVIVEHLLFLVLFGPIVTGFGLIYAAFRDRGLWVLIYPMGILRWQRGEVVTFPWQEIREITFHRVVETAKAKRAVGPDGELITVWLPITKEGSRSLGSHLILRRMDAADAILPSSISNYAKLCQAVQEETFRVMWPEAWNRFLEGKRVHFGPLAASFSGLHRDSEFLDWAELEDVQISTGRLKIRSRLLKRPWIEVPLENVDNPHVLIALMIRAPIEVRRALDAEQ